MLVRNSSEVTNTMYLKQSQTAKEKKDILSGQQLYGSQKAAELTLSSNLTQKIEDNVKTKEIASENVQAAQSDIMSIAKAEEMIQQANLNILNQADDALKVQSGQTAAAAIELLK